MTIQEGGKAGGGREGGIGARIGCQPKPSQGPCGPALDGNHAIGTARFEGAGLAMVHQGAQSPRLFRIGPHQGVDQGHGIIGRAGDLDPEGYGAGDQIVFARGQLSLAVLQGDHGAVKGLDRGLSGFGL